MGRTEEWGGNLELQGADPGEPDSLLHSARVLELPMFARTPGARRLPAFGGATGAFVADTRTSSHHPRYLHHIFRNFLVGAGMEDGAHP